MVFSIRVTSFTVSFAVLAFLGAGPVQAAGNGQNTNLQKLIAVQQKQHDAAQQRVDAMQQRLDAQSGNSRNAQATQQQIAARQQRLDAWQQQIDALKQGAAQNGGGAQAMNGANGNRQAGQCQQNGMQGRTMQGQQQNAGAMRRAGGRGRR